MADSAVSLVYRGNLDASEVNLIRIIEFMGAAVSTVNLSGETSLSADFLKNLVTTNRCLMISAQTLTAFGEGLRPAIGRPPGAADQPAKVLVYGFEPSVGDADLLRELTSGTLVAIDELPVATQRIDVTRDAVCRQLGGVSFDAPECGVRYSFLQASGPGAFTPLIVIGQNPYFVRLQDECSDVMLLAGGQIADLDCLIPRDTSMLHCFAGLAPVLMFLRDSLHPHIWHNQSPAACFIIDDPLLKRRYGCLDYGKLLELMDLKRFSTSIAFIPWNYRRSQQAAARLFGSRPDSYSLCVHGCDHTGGEFGSRDPEALRDKARLAIERMKWHRTKSGVDFDDVMVFPQGIFSTAAMGALRSCGYLAAVNSTAYPVDSVNTLTLRDLMQVAVVRFSGFPLFTRRYPRQFPELAFDLFLGRPALLVEHHSFFRNGYQELAELIDKLQLLEPRLQWLNLAAICSRACRTRLAEDGEVHVQFFTDRFQLRNETSHAQRYVLTAKMLVDPNAELIVNGEHVVWQGSSDGMQVRLSLAAREIAELRIEEREPEAVSTSRKPGLRYKAGVLLRRHLSEIRDNYFWRMSPLGGRVVRDRRTLARMLWGDK